MKRIERTIKAYGYSDKLTMAYENYRKEIWHHFSEEMRRDLTGFGMWSVRTDITSSILFPDNKEATAEVVAKEEGVIAGLEEVVDFYETRGVEIKIYKQDGDKVKYGEKVMELKGYTKDLDKFERVGLNFMQRMSGIATMTSNLKDKIKGCNTYVVGTRKSEFRYRDKRAITLGGGLSHRLGLYDAILMKDNHLASIKKEGFEEDYIEESIRRAAIHKDYNLKFIEVEVEDLGEAMKAARSFKEFVIKDKESIDTTIPCIIMLDNMTPSEIKKVISKLKEEDLYDYVLLEASGKINKKNIKRYAEAGVDTISMGCLTHSVDNFDLSQNIIEEEL